MCLFLGQQPFHIAMTHHRNNRCSDYQTFWQLQIDISLIKLCIWVQVHISTWDIPPCALGVITRKLGQSLAICKGPSLTGVNLAACLPSHAPCSSGSCILLLVLPWSHVVYLLSLYTSLVAPCMYGDAVGNGSMTTHCYRWPGCTVSDPLGHDFPLNII